MFREALIPSNVAGLCPVCINEILYQKLPFKAKINDQHLRGINTYFARGIGSLLSGLDHMIKLEASLSCNDKARINAGVLVLGEDERFDIHDFRHTLGNALRILTVEHAVVLAKCRSSIKPYLDPKFHHLLKVENPISDKLLGPNLEQKIVDGHHLSDATKKLHTFDRWPFYHSHQVLSTFKSNTNRFSTYFHRNTRAQNDKSSRPYGNKYSRGGFTQAPTFRGQCSRGSFRGQRFRGSNRR